jgi:hypothetical protein
MNGRQSQAWASERRACGVVTLHNYASRFRVNSTLLDACIRSFPRGKAVWTGLIAPDPPLEEDSSA